VFVQGGDG